jgi:hypothetical protein
MINDKTIGISAVESILENMRVTMSLLTSNPKLETAVTQANMLQSSAAVESLSGITKQFDSIFSTNQKITSSFLEAISFQTKLLRNTQQFYLTETLGAFRNSLIHNDYFSAIETVKKSMQSAIIEVPDMALLKLNRPLFDIIDADLPRGLRSTIDTLHVRTAIDLSKSKGISYNSNDATFFVETSPNDNGTAKVVNVIFSAARLFNDLTEEELLALLRHLSTYPSLGSEHVVGKKVMNIVKSITATISFDAENFYHARSLDDDAPPYTDEDMTCAPHGITSFGRFNHIGDNYYYFSDKKEGAIEEVRKHSPRNKVQVARLKATRKNRMVDISENEENVFLKYCRFKFDPNSIKRVPREYLIPAFFSDCCKLQGFDGIKYYGTQSYKNYVTWKDGDFKFVDQEIIS